MREPCTFRHANKHDNDDGLHVSSGVCLLDWCGYPQTLSLCLYFFAFAQLFSRGALMRRLPYVIHRLSMFLWVSSYDHACIVMHVRVAIVPQRFSHVTPKACKDCMDCRMVCGLSQPGPALSVFSPPPPSPSNFVHCCHGQHVVPRYVGGHIKHCCASYKYRCNGS